MEECVDYTYLLFPFHTDNYKVPLFLISGDLLVRCHSAADHPDDTQEGVSSRAESTQSLTDPDRYLQGSFLQMAAVCTRFKRRGCSQTSRGVFHGVLHPGLRFAL